MVDNERLKTEIKERGYKQRYLAAKLNLTPNGLSRKVNGITEFKASEIETLSDLLCFSNEERNNIFFAHKVI